MFLKQNHLHLGYNFLGRDYKLFLRWSKSFGTGRIWRWNSNRIFLRWGG